MFFYVDVLESPILLLVIIYSILKSTQVIFLLI